MGQIFDARAARQYESWYQSPQGRAMERLVKESITTLLELQPGERLLDIGCGEGHHLQLFSRLGFDTCGLDASPYMIRRARERVGHRCTLELGEAEHLPFEDNEFDLALLINTLEFLDHPLEALLEAGRVARRSVFIGVTNSLSWYSFCLKVGGLFRKSLFTYATPYNLWELKACIRSALGEVPISWRCAQVKAPALERIGTLINERWYRERCPFGSFLGLCATLHYRVRTIQTPLKTRLEQAGQPAVRGLTMGELRNEGSLSV